MELLAVIKGLESVEQNKTKVTVFSDSKYVVDAFNQNWIKGWQLRGWKTSAKKDVKNQDLWQALVQVSAKHDIKWQWVKGHNNDPDNEYVDRLARAAAEEQAAR